MSLNDATPLDTPELNNAGTPPNTVQETSVEQYTRDPEFYFPDGNVVFLVDNVLFKLQASLLAPRGSSAIRIRTPPSNEKVLLEFSGVSNAHLGTDDANPIVIPDVEARGFRVLLIALLGWPGNETYMSFLTSASSKDKHSQELFLRYLDLGYAAYLLMLDEIVCWAYDQLELTIQSATRLAEADWDTSMMIRVIVGVSIAIDEDLSLMHELQSFFQLLISATTIGSNLTMRPEPGSNINACLFFFKSSTIFDDYSHLVLGSALLIILSLGPHSAVWRDQLTRDERSMLYTAYAHLVTLQSNSNLELDWLRHPSCSTDILRHACSNCSQQCSIAWQNSFGRIGALNSPIPLEDVRKLLALPRCRQIFADSVRGESSCSIKCNETILKRIDAVLYRLFTHKIVREYRDLHK